MKLKQMLASICTGYGPSLVGKRTVGLFFRRVFLKERGGERYSSLIHTVLVGATLADSLKKEFHRG